MIFFRSFVERLASLRGARRLAAAFAFGVLAAFAFPPFDWIPLWWLSFPALVFLLRGSQGGRAAFGVGWSFAFGQLTFSLYWIAGSLFVDLKEFWWVLPFAVAGLPALFAVYYGLAALLARRWGFEGMRGVFFFALCWFLADMARGHCLTGFPWDIAGYIWGDVLPVLQITSLVGIEGLSLATVLLAVLPASFFVCRTRRVAWLWVALGVAVLAGASLWGGARLAGADRLGFVPNVRLRLVQPGIAQAMKWKADQRLLNFDKLLDASFAAPGEKPVTHFIWPETATAFYLTEDPAAREEIARRMPVGSFLLTGVVRRAATETGALRYYNSLIVMDSKGDVVGGYDKRHLVPFGEFMPLRSLVPFRVITALGTDFTAGEGGRSLRAPGLPSFSPLVCYEAIFSGQVVEREDPPHMLVNVTNDAWYEGTIGPAQHFSIARVRAIEEGVPLARVANKGLTGVVDPFGRIVALKGPDGVGFVDADLPRALNGFTLFGKQGATFPWLMALLLWGGLVLTRMLHREASRTG